MADSKNTIEEAAKSTLTKHDTETKDGTHPSFYKPTHNDMHASNG